MYEITLFKNRFDNKTYRKMVCEDWNSFVKLFKRLSEQVLEGKHQAALISPAVYTSGTTRSNKNVEYWGKWAAIDVDEGDFCPSTLSETFGHFNHIIYSTASSTAMQPKFRLVFELSRKVQANEIKHFWYALHKLTNEMGDGQTSDLSRMYYVPASYRTEYHFFYSNILGKPLDVDKVLNSVDYVSTDTGDFLDRLPEELRTQVLSHRKSRMDNTDITWTDYKDCPFFPKGLAEKYKSITDTGWYHTMYCIMVAIATSALKKKYPITQDQIADLCCQFDREHGHWYEKRPMRVEAASALEYAYRNVSID